MHPIKEIESYQIMLTCSDEIPVRDFFDACETIQAYCLQAAPLDQGSWIRMLEQMMLVAYQKLYPETFGGIFEPLIKSIGRTHCHFTNPDKFTEFSENHYWLQFNILTNCIEGLRDGLQPISLEEMIHVLHFIAVTKNRYYSKHSASLAFTNKDREHGGVFVLFKDMIILSPDHTGKVSHDFCDTHCDIVLDNRDVLPIFKSHKNWIIEYLNSWGNEAMKEIIVTEKTLPALRKHLEKYAFNFTVGPYSEHIKNEFSNIHFTRGLLDIQEKNGTTWEETIAIYQYYIDQYINQSDSFSTVFFISNATPGRDDAAFSDLYKQIRRLFSEKYGTMYDFSPDTNQVLSTPEMIITMIQNELSYFPHKKVLVTIGLHGEKDGSASYAGGNFTRHHFQIIFDLAAKNPNLQLFIMSCWSARKTDSLKGNIIMTSSNQVSYANYSKYFLESFNKGESLYLAHMYAMMHYHKSLLPTSFMDNNGSTQELCPLSDKHW